MLRTLANALRLNNDLLDVAAQRFGFGLPDDAAVVENRDFVGDWLDFVQQVRTVKHGAALALQVRDEVAVELLPHDGVEAECGIIEDDELRSMGEGQHQAEADVLALSTNA